MRQYFEILYYIRLSKYTSRTETVNIYSIESTYKTPSHDIYNFKSLIKHLKRRPNAIIKFRYSPYVNNVSYISMYGHKTGSVHINKNQFKIGYLLTDIK